MAFELTTHTGEGRPQLGSLLGRISAEASVGGIRFLTQRGRRPHSLVALWPSPVAAPSRLAPPDTWQGQEPPLSGTVLPTLIGEILQEPGSQCCPGILLPQWTKDPVTLALVSSALEQTHRHRGSSPPAPASLPSVSSLSLQIQGLGHKPGLHQGISMNLGFGRWSAAPCRETYSALGRVGPALAASQTAPQLTGDAS